MDKERIEKLWFANGRIYILTNTGSELSHPLEVSPPLYLATKEQRERYEIWGDGQSIRWEEIDEDIHISHFHEVEIVNHNNEVNRLLSRFPWIDMKVFARYLGMHWTKLARYRYGVWTASPETVADIRNGIIALGKEIESVTEL